MREYKLIGCTAIAKSAGDTEPQNAVLCLTIDDGAVIRDSAIVFFGCEAEGFTEEDFESYPASSESIDLDTIIIQGKPMNEYIF